MYSIRDRFDATSGRPTGFDYLRIALAVGVIASHTIGICYGMDDAAVRWTGPLRAFNFFLVPSFFALSGFLVAGSLERNDLPSFLTLRVLRIYPALVMEVILSAFVLGPLLTTDPLASYVADPRFWRYLVNVTGHISYLLPGLFEHMPDGAKVNSQLWTVPYELWCYVLISLIALATLFRRPRTFMIALVSASLILFAKQVLTHDFAAAAQRAPGAMVVLCYLFGVAIYKLAHRIPWNPLAFSAALAAAWATCSWPAATFLAPLPVAYVTVYVGLLNFRKVWLLRSADYSYGLYLYGYPVQKTVAFLFPQHRNPLFNFVVGVLAAGVFAAFSWHVVEKPIQQKKKLALGWVQSLVARLRPGAGATALSARRPEASPAFSAAPGRAASPRRRRVG